MLVELGIPIFTSNKNIFYKTFEKLLAMSFVQSEPKSVNVTLTVTE